MPEIVKLVTHIKRFFVSFICIHLVFLTACNKQKIPFKVVVEFDLSKQIDSTAFGEVKFGICKNDFLNQIKIPLVENRMTEPLFGSLVTEIESAVNIGAHTFNGYYYFDAEDSLYKITLLKHCINKYPRDEYHAAYDTIYHQMKSKYGDGKNLKTLQDHKRLYWGLKNKSVELEKFCFERDCIIECSIIDARLFKKNKNRNK